MAPLGDPRPRAGHGHALELARAAEEADPDPRQPGGRDRLPRARALATRPRPVRARPGPRLVRPEARPPVAGVDHPRVGATSSARSQTGMLARAGSTSTTGSGSRSRSRSSGCSRGRPPTAPASRRSSASRLPGARRRRRASRATAPRRASRREPPARRHSKRPAHAARLGRRRRPAGGASRSRSPAPTPRPSTSPRRGRGRIPPGGRRAGLTSHAFRPRMIGQEQRVHTGWLSNEGGRIRYAPHTQAGYALPPSKALFVVGVDDRDPQRASARRATRGSPSHGVRWTAAGPRPACSGSRSGSGSRCSSPCSTTIPPTGRRPCSPSPPAARSFFGAVFGYALWRTRPRQRPRARPAARRARDRAADLGRDRAPRSAPCGGSRASTSSSARSSPPSGCSRSSSRGSGSASVGATIGAIVAITVVWALAIPFVLRRARDASRRGARPARPRNSMAAEITGERHGQRGSTVRSSRGRGDGRRAWARGRAAQLERSSPSG